MSTIGYKNVIDRDGATVTATNAISTLPAINLAHSHVVKVFRATGLTTTISVDAGEQVTARQIAVIGTNYGSGTLTLTADNSAPGGNGVLSGFTDFAVDTVYGQILGDLGSDVSARYWDLEINASSVTDGSGQLEAGRLFLGPAIKPNINVAYGLSMRVNDQSELQRTIGAQQVFEYPQLREVTLSFGPGITEDEAYRDLFRTLDREAGTSREVLFTAITDHAVFGVDTMLWGFISNLGPLTHNSYGVYEKEYTITEAR